MNVAICIPARDTVCTGFAHDLAILASRWFSELPSGSGFNIHTVSGTLIADQRMKLVLMAIKSGADYVLFLDSDMRFPSDTLHRLIVRDADIIAANYPTRRKPVKTVAFSDFKKLECIYTDDDSVGTQEVDAVGMGCMLIKTSVFKKLPIPWFDVKYEQDLKAHVGEDMYFCHLAKKHGLKVYIDHDLSKRIRHIGSYEYTHDDAVVEQMLTKGD
jgi:GT2 family glycosyltransferase